MRTSISPNLCKKVKPRNLALWALLIVGATSLLCTPEAFAVKAGEMKSSVDYINGLLDNNIVPALLGVGLVASIGVAFAKSHYSPLAISVFSIMLYTFASKWVGTVYALCV